MPMPVRFTCIHISVMFHTSQSTSPSGAVQYVVDVGGGRTVTLCTPSREASWHGDDDATGYQIWAGSKVLLAYMEHQHGSDLGDKRVLELGAGLGLAGIGIALLGAAEVVITDKQSLVETALGDNVRANVPVGNATAAALNWGRSGWGGVVCEMAGGWDFIVCSDCVYTKASQIALTYTIRELMPPGGHTKLIVTFTRRSSTCDGFSARLLDMGFNVEVLNATDVEERIGLKSKAFVLLIDRPLCASE